MIDPATRSKARADASRRRSRRPDRLLALIAAVCLGAGVACLTLWIALTFGAGR